MPCVPFEDTFSSLEEARRPSSSAHFTSRLFLRATVAYSANRSTLGSTLSTCVHTQAYSDHGVVAMVAAGRASQGLMPCSSASSCTDKSGSSDPHQSIVLAVMQESFSSDASTSPAAAAGGLTSPFARACVSSSSSSSGGGGGGQQQPTALKGCRSSLLARILRTKSSAAAASSILDQQSSSSSAPGGSNCNSSGSGSGNAEQRQSRPSELKASLRSSSSTTSVHHSAAVLPRKGSRLRPGGFSRAKSMGNLSSRAAVRPAVAGGTVQQQQQQQKQMAQSLDLGEQLLWSADGVCYPMQAAAAQHGGAAAQAAKPGPSSKTAVLLLSSSPTGTRQLLLGHHPKSLRTAAVSQSMVQLGGSSDAQSLAAYSDEREVYVRQLSGTISTPTSTCSSNGLVQHDTVHQEHEQQGPQQQQQQLQQQQQQEINIQRNQEQWQSYMLPLKAAAQQQQQHPLQPASPPDVAVCHVHNKSRASFNNAVYDDGDLQPPRQLSSIGAASSIELCEPLTNSSSEEGLFDDAAQQQQLQQPYELHGGLQAAAEPAEECSSSGWQQQQSQKYGQQQYGQQQRYQQQQQELPMACGDADTTNAGSQLISSGTFPGGFDALAAAVAADIADNRIAAAGAAASSLCQATSQQLTFANLAGSFDGSLQCQPPGAQQQQQQLSAPAKAHQSSEAGLGEVLKASMSQISKSSITQVLKASLSRSSHRLLKQSLQGQQGQHQKRQQQQPQEQASMSLSSTDHLSAFAEFASMQELSAAWDEMQQQQAPQQQQQQQDTVGVAALELQLPAPKWPNRTAATVAAAEQQATSVRTAAAASAAAPARKATRSLIFLPSGATAASNAALSQTIAAAASSAAVSAAAAAAAATQFRPRPPPGGSFAPQRVRPWVQLRHCMSAAALVSQGWSPAAADDSDACAEADAGTHSAAAGQQSAVSEAVGPVLQHQQPAAAPAQQQSLPAATGGGAAAVTGSSGGGRAGVAGCVPIAVARHCPRDIQAHSWQPPDFVQTRKLYEGKIAVVLQGYHAASGRPLALKVYTRARLDIMERFQLAREVCLHMRSCHPYIASLYAAYKDVHHIYLLMELAPRGNLYQMLMALQVAPGCPKRLDEAEAVVGVIKPLMSALAYLHDQGIIHRDIKLENVLLMCDGSIKLADFGLSIDTQHEPANTRLGTQGYFAPEVLALPLKASPFEGKSPAEAASRPSYSCKVDVWSAGVVCYEVLTGRAPFAAENVAKVLRAILHRSLVYPEHLSPQAVNFLSAALTREPAARATACQLLQHPFIAMHDAGHTTHTTA